MDQAVILSAVRTPIGKFQGGLAPLSAPQLGAKVVAEAVRRAGIEPKSVDEIIMGNVVQAGLGQNPARQAGLGGGLDVRVAAMTINKVCGSGLKAVGLAAQSVMLGEAEIVVAGGMESMSNCPYLLPGARTGYRFGNAEIVDSMVHDGLWDVYNDFHMGITAELVAEKYGITRQEQDQFALESHQRAVRARKSCFIESQILPIEIPQKKGDPVVIKYDESPREDASLEALGEIAARVQERRHGDGGQRSGHERRRRGARRHQRAQRGASGQDADGADRRAGRERRRSQVDHGWRRFTPWKNCSKKPAGTATATSICRTERSVCRGRDCRDARSCASTPRK